MNNKNENDKPIVSSFGATEILPHVFPINQNRNINKSTNIKEEDDFFSDNIILNVINNLSIPIILFWALFLLFVGFGVFQEVYTALLSLTSIYILIDRKNIVLAKISMDTPFHGSNITKLRNIFYYLSIPVLFLNVLYFTIFFIIHDGYQPFLLVILIGLGIFILIYKPEWIRMPVYYVKRMINSISFKIYHKTQLYECTYCGTRIQVGQISCSNCGENIKVCSICKLPLKKEDQIIQCRHCLQYFHKPHWMKWINKGKSCPVCKK